MLRTVPAGLAALLLVNGCGGSVVDASVGTSVLAGSVRPCSSAAVPVPAEVSAVSPYTVSLLPADATVVSTEVTPAGLAVLQGWSRTAVPELVEAATLAALAGGARVDRVESEPREGFVAFTTDGGEGSLVAGPVRCPDDATGFVLTVPHSPSSTTPDEEST